MNCKTCIVVCGPTAVGKTDYAIDLARRYKTAIISADSRQCYKELNIGVARPTPGQLAEVPHYFIATHSIFDGVTVKTFEEYAIGKAREIFLANDVIVMCGGTGLYIKAFTQGIDDIPPTAPAVRRDIKFHYEREGLVWLQRQLQLLDPEFYKQGEIDNPQRSMRALEVVRSTGRSILSYFSSPKQSRDFDIKYEYVQLPRQELYNRINSRVDKMLDDGLLKEAKNLYQFRQLNALQSVGYKEMFRYLDGEISLDLAIEEMKMNTRRYAKRQVTWFNGQLNIRDPKS